MTTYLHYAAVSDAGISANFVDESDTYGRAHETADDTLKEALIAHAASQLATLASLDLVWKFCANAEDVARQEARNAKIIKTFVEYPTFFYRVRACPALFHVSDDIFARVDAERAMLAIEKTCKESQKP